MVENVVKAACSEGQNMENAADYAKLVALGKPDFIEIKSVTFCGESKAYNMIRHQCDNIYDLLLLYIL